MQRTVVFTRSQFRRDFRTDSLKGRLEFSVIDSSLIGTSREVGTIHTIEITITDEVLNNWRLAGAEWSYVSDDMRKVAFQIIEEHLTDQLKKGPLPEDELPPLLLSTRDSPNSCPYNLSNIRYPAENAFTVDIDDRASQPLAKCLADFVGYVQSEMRMTFWQNVNGRYEWVSQPEQRARDLLRTFLNGRFGDSIYTFEEVRAGAGVIDLFIISPRGEKAIVELKMCGHGYTQNWARGGIEQLIHYMENKDTTMGYLVVLDSRVRDFLQGFELTQAVGERVIDTLVADLRPYVKQKDVPSGV